ncbi:unnamed protein product [Oppiella nova]|uniref:RCK N-terminal domain-containing protein n=1 Tax=Oppiella nova TaxID=334625 RepID=A0A7R9QDV6_9ACAR|nr:unnamed protein product [Oppiella nova]CAG2163817.1 unnamed protein product [Oppiella nova]
MDLKRLQAHRASTCVVLADKLSSDADSGDANTVMRYCIYIEDTIKKRYIHESGFDTIDKTEEINLLNITSIPIKKSHDSGDNLQTSSPKKMKTETKLKRYKRDNKKKGKESRSRSTSSSSTSSDSSRQTDGKHEEIRRECDYDSCALFHYCPNKSIDDCILQKDSQLLRQLSDHVIVGLFVGRNSSAVELKNLVLTLRTSNIDVKHLRPVLIVADIEAIARQWIALQNIPEIYLFNGSLLSRDDLYAINLMVCNICVILTPNGSEDIDPKLADKMAILATLNVKNITIDESMLAQIPVTSTHSTTSAETMPPLELQRKGSSYGVNVSVITELRGEDYLQNLRNECLKWKPLTARTLRHRDRSRFTHISLRGPLYEYRDSKYGELVLHLCNSYASSGAMRCTDPTRTDVNWVVPSVSPLLIEHKNILEFEVSMRVAIGVHVLDSIAYLRKDLKDLTLVQVFVFVLMDQILSQISRSSHF